MTDPLKVITQPGTGLRFKMGRKRPKVHGPRLSWKNYMLQTFPDPLVSADYTAAPEKFLADILSNDVSGDCTCAGAYHIAGTILANSAIAIPYSADDVTRFYMLLSGWNGVEDDPSDTGLLCQDVLNYWQNKGLLPDSRTITGYVHINSTNKPEVEAALWLFENLYIGFEMPDAWVDPMPNGDGFVFDVAGDPDPGNGHCVMAAKYDVDGVHIDSWGLKGLMPWDSVAEYCSRSAHGELYTVLSRDIISKATQKSPAGWNWTQLLSDLQSVSG